MASELALKGGTAIRNRPFTRWPLWGERERGLLLGVLESGSWGGEGPKEREFARRFADYCGAAEAFCVANGTVSLEIALRALGVGPGDEVIVPALTWVSTATAVVHVGATPVFADVREQDWCLDPESIRQRVTARTRAIVPVHLYSQVAEMDQLLELARDLSLWVVEDCAHAHGSRWGDRGVGTLGHIGSFSFQQSKSLTAGEGGAVVTGDGALARRIYALKNCGRRWKEEGAFGFGGNYRLTEFQAAVLLSQFERFEEQLAKRIKNAELFRGGIAALPGVSVLAQKSRVTRQGMYALALRCDPRAFAGVPRDLIAAALQAEGLPVYAPYPVVYRSPLWVSGRHFLKWEQGIRPRERLGLDARCPIAERIAEEEGLTIPHQVFLGTRTDVDDLVAGFEKVQRCASELRLDALKKKIRAGGRALLQKTGIEV
jgi:L-glutamine:2-deoxy-scyllo-inosose/3-amino-2,3-dideoxy-scyllo-inosose aminotransferase